MQNVHIKYSIVDFKENRLQLADCNPSVLLAWKGWIDTPSKLSGLTTLAHKSHLSAIFHFFQPILTLQIHSSYSLSKLFHSIRLISTNIRLILSLLLYRGINMAVCQTVSTSGESNHTCSGILHYTINMFRQTVTRICIQHIHSKTSKGKTADKCDLWAKVVKPENFDSVSIQSVHTSDTEGL